MPDIPNPAELLNAGQLDEAVEAATGRVKQQPTSAARRIYLAELLCLRGDFERADKHLDTASLQDPKAAIGVSLLRQLIRAETARRECWQAGRPPELVDQTSAEVGLQLELLLSLREGNAPRVAEIVAELAKLRSPLAGTCDGQPFTELRDLDDVWQGTLEVLTSTGKYFWIPLARIELLEVTPPAAPRDLLWPEAHLIVRDGSEGQVYLAAQYPQTWQSEDVNLKLGRATEWDESVAGLVQGVGLRMFWVGEQEKTVFELADLSVDAVAKTSD